MTSDCKRNVRNTTVLYSEDNRLKGTVFEFLNDNNFTEFMVMGS